MDAFHNNALSVLYSWIAERFYDFVGGSIITAFKNFNYEAFLLKHNHIAYLIDTNIVDFLSDIIEYCICPWYSPWDSFKQAVFPFAVFFWEIFAKSPVFGFIFTVVTVRWVYTDFYKYVEMGSGATVGGWLKTKFLILFLALIRVDVLSAPFMDPATRPHLGRLFDMDRRPGERPTVVGVGPLRQATQAASPAIVAGVLAAVQQRVARAPGARVEAEGTRLGPITAPGYNNSSSVSVLDGSAALEMHPRDCAELVRAGRAERHPLACAAENPLWRFWHRVVRRGEVPVPANVVHVYAPRDRAELALFRRLLDAAIWFGVQQMPPARQNPAVNANPPVVNGGAPVVNGDGPVVNGVGPVVNGGAPAVDGVAPVVNGDGGAPVVNGDGPGNGDA